MHGLESLEDAYGETRYISVRQGLSLALFSGYSLEEVPSLA